MIHVLGAGNIGSLFALSLSRKFPVEFLMRPSSLKQYVDTSNSTVRIHTPRIETGAVWEKKIPGVATTNLEKPISHLVVAVKCHDIKKALNGIRHAITPNTEIMVLHNGMGVREQLLREVWPFPKDLPKLGFGITDAGVKRSPPQWTFEYTGKGTCTFSTFEDQRNLQTGPSELASMLLDSRELVVSEQVPQDVFEYQQKKKLAVNSVINPLTAILQCPNGALPTLDGFPQHSMLMQKVINESCRVLGLNRYEMWDLVLDVITRTSTNISSMLRDTEDGRTSEIDFINGYIVEQAQRLKMGAPLNLMLRELVKMRTQQTRHEDESVIPLELDEHKRNINS